MNIHSLRYFVTLARVRQYTRASEELCITQPSLSHAISQLENELGVKLFEKIGHKISLTRYGEEFSEIAFEKSVMEEMIKASGMTVEAVYDYDTLDPAHTDSEKLVFVAKKPLV